MRDVPFEKSPSSLLKKLARAKGVVIHFSRSDSAGG
jgi:hypothetical protein